MSFMWWSIRWGNIDLTFFRIQLSAKFCRCLPAFSFHLSHLPGSISTVMIAFCSTVTGSTSPRMRRYTGILSAVRFISTTATCPSGLRKAVTSSLSVYLLKPMRILPGTIARPLSQPISSSSPSVPRYSVGLLPVIFLNTLEKYFSSLNPTLKAISYIFILLSCI